MKFTGPSQQIGISLPADMVAYLKLRKAQEGVTISAQCRLALENDILDRAEVKANPLELRPDEFEARWEQFIRGKVLDVPGPEQPGAGGE